MTAEKAQEPSAQEQPQPAADEPTPAETTMQLPRVRDIGPLDPTIQLQKVTEPVGVEPETREIPPQQPGPDREESGPAASESGMTCPNCGEPIWPDDNFCQACSTELAPAVSSGEQAEAVAACPTCQNSTISPEGYCESCGYKVPSGRDHVELDLGLVAGVTDRGQRHTRNEDAMALATANSASGPVAVAVVCDGVSTSSNPDEASQKAAQAAIQVLLSAVRSGSDLAKASARAVMSAQKALNDMAEEGDLFANAPSATFVSSVATTTEVTVCWLGDSRVYWIDAAGPAESRQLTVDDSVAQELIKTGLMSEAEALASPQGHVVTGWIGADAQDAKPHVSVIIPEGPGLVLLCSDGLWNYRPDAAGIAELAGPDAISEPLRAAGKLVNFANEQGGSDNITVALIPFPPRRRPDATEEIDPEATATYAATQT
ncbi:MAG TPA: PP2C family serine/threonine-protein phosphatase [Streptosporangiaceae bacterium]|nr:PP2C family serine/threonine-protein phosphatase [Streptosporangiaceae bacterium]